MSLGFLSQIGGDRPRLTNIKFLGGSLVKELDNGSVSVNTNYKILNLLKILSKSFHKTLPSSYGISAEGSAALSVIDTGIWGGSKRTNNFVRILGNVLEIVPGIPCCASGNPES